MSSKRRWGRPVSDERQHPAPGTAVASGAGSIVIFGPNEGTVSTNVILQPPSVSWPVRVGRVPDLASAFQPRAELRDQVVAAWRTAEGVVLTRSAGDDATTGDRERVERGTQVMSGGGGVGKSQLAAWFAHQAAAEQVDLIAWIDAADAARVTAGYALAAAKVAAPGADGRDLSVDARYFVDWLAATDRRWLIVLDDIADPKHLATWWPPGRRNVGWTLATTRRRDAALLGTNRTVVSIDVYRPDESRAYMVQRLSDAGCAHLVDASLDDLAAALGHLPLALSHAVSFMIDQACSCRAYLSRYTGSLLRLDDLMPADADTDDYNRPVAATLLMALEAADTAAPAGLARPAIALAAVLDPAGHPDILWSTTAVTDYLTTHRSPPDTTRADPDQAAAAVSLLHRYGLLTRSTEPGPRSVRIHALTARAARETTSDPTPAVQAAADALLSIWPQVPSREPELAVALRANVATLRTRHSATLWHPAEGGHRILTLAGNSIGDIGLHHDATAYFRDLAAEATRHLGPNHQATLTARHQTGRWLTNAGATPVAVLESLLADCETELGPDHPDTLATWHNLARSIDQAGEHAAAVGMFERVVAARTRVLGRAHQDTLMSRLDLATSRGYAGDAARAANELAEVHTDQTRTLGAEHPDTLTALGNLARWRGNAGDAAGALRAFEELVPIRARALGEAHPHTLSARRNVANWQHRSGDDTSARATYRAVLDDQTRLLGADHVDTMITCHELADLEGDTATLETLLNRRTRVLGQDNPHTRQTRSRLDDWRIESQKGGDTGRRGDRAAPSCTVAD